MTHSWMTFNMIQLILNIIFLLAISANAFAVGSPDFLPDGSHPRIWLTSSELSTLAAARDAADNKWTALESWCDAHIADAGYDTHPANQTTLDLTNWGGDNNYTIGYRMSGWAKHLYSFALAYQVLKQPGTAQDTTKAATYAARARTLLIDGISAKLSAGEETGNGLHALRVGSLHDITVNSAEGAALSVGVASFKNGYAARFLAAVPIAYDWIYDTLSSGDKTELTAMMLRWVDWSRGVRSSYNNGVLKSGNRYHEDTNGDCTGTNICTSVGAVQQKGNDYINIGANFGGGYALMMTAVVMATYGDFAEDDTYLTYIKTYLNDYVVTPLESDLKHSGGDSPEGWNYGGGFLYSLPGIYGYYTATGDTAVSAMDWPKGLVRASIHRVSGDFLTVPMWGYWTGVPYKENRITHVNPFVGIEQKLRPTSDEAKLGQFLLDTATFTTSLEEWADLFYNSTNVAASSPAALSEPRSYVAVGNGLYSSRSSWSQADDVVHVTARLEGKVSASHEGYDEGHITLLRGTDVLLGHDNRANDAPPSVSFNTILFNGASHHASNPVQSTPSISRYVDSPEFSYVSGNIENSWKRVYQANRCELFRRSLLHLRPGIIIVSDITRSNSTLGNLKEWYTQYEGNPDISGDTITATVGDSKVFVATKYPAGSFTETSPYTNSYRVKFVPTTLQEYDQFLHVIEATGSADSQTAASLIAGVGGRGALVGSTVAMFTGNQDGNNIAGLTYTVDATTHYVADLAPNATVAVTRNGTPVTGSPFDAGSAGIITFTADAGSATYAVAGGSSPVCDADHLELCDIDNCTDAGGYWCESCQDTQCPPPGPVCYDQIQNGDETGVDCGGSCPNACAVVISVQSVMRIGDSYYKLDD